MHTTRAMGITATLIAVLAASGCSGGSSDGAQSSVSRREFGTSDHGPVVATFR